MSRAIRIAIACASVAATPAQVLVHHSWSAFNGDSSLAIPDANAAGISDTRTIFAEAIDILKVTLNLEIVGEYNGDLYVTLQHDSGFAVILNRPGRSATLPFGYNDRGFNISVSDAAPNGDVHKYREVVTLSGSGPLTGAWQADARSADPSISLATSQRGAFLSSFQGQNLAGEWTLFAADVSAGGQSQILSWGLEITVVPEPREIALCVAAGLLGFASFKRFSRV